MRFELQLAYPDWPGNDRKSLHVDAEAFEALGRLAEGEVKLGDLVPLEVVAELQRPMYGPGTGSDALQLWGMGVFNDL